MIFLLARRLLELFILSVIPGFFATLIIQIDSIQGALFYPILLIVMSICTFIFFGGNALMMRRMVRDIKSKEKYLFVQWAAFAIYAVLAVCICVFGWKDLRAVLLFHARFFEVLADPIVIDPANPSRNLITPTESMLITALLYGIMTAWSYPHFNKLYIKEQKDLAQAERINRKLVHEARKKYEAEQIEREKAIREKKVTPEPVYFREPAYEKEDNTLYTVKELKKLDKLEDLDPNVSKKHRRINSKTNNSQKLKVKLKHYILNFGSYDFYQRIIEKEEYGENVGAYIRAHWKRKLSLGVFIHKRRR